MEFLALLGIGLLISVIIVPWIALSKANAAMRELEELRDEFDKLSRRFHTLQTAREREDRPLPITVSLDFPVKTAAKEAAPASKSAPTPAAPAATPSQGTPMAEGKPPAQEEQPSLDIQLPPVTPPRPERRIETPKPVRPPQPRPAPPPPPQPSEFELLTRRWLGVAKEWLFGGNLVFKVGLLILFVGVAFLIRLASNYVTVPVEFWLAGVAAGAIALLVWGWRIRESRRAFALPAQGAALAILMLVTFGAFKLFHVIPSGATFAVLFVLIAFTCMLAVLQDALWLAVFGISGGFAAPILLSTGGGSHIALFSYYTLLNAGILAIALKRSWRVLNVLGFLFTFVVGAAWGEQRYLAENYQSAQGFLIGFWLFYIAIAVVYAWRRAPELKSYVDGTLVFGVPMAGMALQYGLVKDMQFGMAISALVIAFTYASAATVLWRWRQGTLRLLVESFLALAIVFGTLSIPLALDGRWTSAAWAVEGAAIVWIGLKQKQKLAWAFGVAVQLGSWIAFVASLAGLDPLSTLKGNVGLGFLILGVTGALLALLFRRHQENPALNDEARARQLFTGMASGFICFAVLWLLLGMWVEAWLRLQGVQRATVLVATALALVFALQFLGRRSTWRLPELLGGIVAGVAGVAFVTLMFRYMNWRNGDVYESTLGAVLADSSLLGGLMLSGGALASAFAFKTRPRIATWWWLAAEFWWCGFALHGLAHAIEFVSGGWSWPISFWAFYSVGLAVSAWGFAALTHRGQFDATRRLLLPVWQVASGVALFLFWNQVDKSVWWNRYDTAALPQGSIADAAYSLLASPVIGALILCAMAWRALVSHGRDGTQTKRIAKLVLAMWAIYFAIVWYAVIDDAVAVFVASVLRGVTPDPAQWWQLSYSQCAVVVAALSGMLFLWRARVTNMRSLRWLAVPAALFQAVFSVVLLLELYVEAKLPAANTGLAFLASWLGIAWCLREWQRNEWRATQWSLKALHFGRVIAPWLAIAPLVSHSVAIWLYGGPTASMWEGGWIVGGMWPDYLAAWVSMGSLFVVLRQADSAGWPLAPLHEWYRRRLIPLATMWGVLLTLYWNLRQDGGMAPLPYLPILNPLDLTTGFCALLTTTVWRANVDVITERWRAFGIKLALALSFGWLNLMLLRTAAHYLGLPYRFDDLYHSQFVQAMLSIVWTLTALILMRQAVRLLSKPLWMVGAGLLVVVVAKLIFADLSNAGSIARIVSFIGVGGLMLVIGYLAPFPRSKSEEST